MTDNLGSAREAKIGGWLLLAGGVLFAVVQLVLAWLSHVPSDPARLLAWVEEHFAQLAFADEVLAFAVPILTVGIILLYRHLRQRSPVSALVGLVTYGVTAVVYTIVMLELGRLIYPVNGLPISTDGALATVSQVYAGVHSAALALGAAMIAFGVAWQKRSMLTLSIIAGALQIVGTYYATTPPFWLLATAIIAGLAWVGVAARCMVKPGGADA